jgi:hypothetical protein
MADPGDKPIYEALVISGRRKPGASARKTTKRKPARATKVARRKAGR